MKCLSSLLIIISSALLEIAIITICMFLSEEGPLWLRGTPVKFGFGLLAIAFFASIGNILSAIILLVKINDIQLIENPSGKRH